MSKCHTVGNHMSRLILSGGILSILVNLNFVVLGSFLPSVLVCFGVWFFSFNRPMGTKVGYPARV